MSKDKYQNLVTIDEACAILHVSRRTMNRLLARGDLRSFKIGKLVRISPKDIAEYLEENTKPVLL